ncbi:hypothetical protein B0H10DRAFT_2084161, partial [Mycena sp. CBHHK59/15]
MCMPHQAPLSQRSESQAVPLYLPESLNCSLSCQLERVSGHFFPCSSVFLSNMCSRLPVSPFVTTSQSPPRNPWPKRLHLDCPQTVAETSPALATDSHRNLFSRPRELLTQPLSAWRMHEMVAHMSSVPYMEPSHMHAKTRRPVSWDTPSGSAVSAGRQGSFFSPSLDHDESWIPSCRAPPNVNNCHECAAPLNISPFVCPHPLGCGFVFFCPVTNRCHLWCNICLIIY